MATAAQVTDRASDGSRRRTGAAGGTPADRRADRPSLGYRATAWLLARPAGARRPARSSASLRRRPTWPGRRSGAGRTQNFGHVLGLPPDDPRVRRLALRAYREYGRYLVELMRLPSLPPEEVGRLVGDLDDRDARSRRIWAASPAAA